MYPSNLINSNAVLSNVYLSNTNLWNANLSNSIIIQPRFYNDVIVNSDSDFDGSLIDDNNFIKYLQKNSCKNIPDMIRNKKELKEKIEKQESINKDN